MTDRQQLIDSLSSDLPRVKPAAGSGALALLELQLQDSTPLLARITRRSAEDLALKEGMSVYAQIKSVAVLP